jgi:hypothetical protein
MIFSRALPQPRRISTQHTKWNPLKDRGNEALVGLQADLERRVEDA